MALFPEQVKTIAGPLDIDGCRPRGIPSSKQFRELYPDGRMGSDASLADRHKGERIRQAAIQGLITSIKRVTSPS